MEVIYFGRSFTSEGFHNTDIIFRRESEPSKIYYASSPEQFLLERIPAEADLANCTFQRVAALMEYLPVWEPYMLQVPEPRPRSEIHIKKLQNHDYVAAPDLVAAQTIKDLENCQMLMQHPHPNVVPYLGCLVEDGRVTRLCFRKASKTLMEMVNPKMVLKVKFDASCHPLPDKEKLLQGWESGIRHIHSIGYVHNDVHPTNLMVLDDGTPVVIDLDMLTLKGARQYGGRMEWSDQDVSVASEKRDWDGMHEIKTWLEEGTEKKWLFGSLTDLIRRKPQISPNASQVESPTSPVACRLHRVISTFLAGWAFGVHTASWAPRLLVSSHGPRWLHPDLDRSAIVDRPIPLG